MSKNNNSNVAIIFDDLTEFFVMRPAIDRLKQEKIPVDIIVPYDSGYNGLAEHTIQKIKEYGYNPKKDVPKNKTYQILFTPYYLNVVNRTKYNYHFQYPYGPISTKPTPTYTPEYLIIYDAIFSFNTYDSDFLTAYGAKVYSLPYWRYHNFKKQPKNSHGKPTLLILPTFGPDTSCIEYLNSENIIELKKYFHIITKSHHAIHFGRDGDDTLQKLKSFTDDFYDSDIPIDELLKKANYVLSDNSGAIFESICAGIPVTIFAKNINSRCLSNINTPQFSFTQAGYFPYTNQPNQLLPTILSTKKYAKKQDELKNKLFLPLSTKTDPIKPFLDVVKKYLSSDPSRDYHKVLHDLLKQEWQKRDNEILQQSAKIIKLKEEIENLYSSTSWKITKPLRKIGQIKERSKNA